MIRLLTWLLISASTTATVYNAVPEQCGEHPTITASGRRIEGDRLVTSSLRKTDIPKYSRLFFIPNDYKTKGGNQPDYVGFFIPVKEGEK